MRSTRRPIAFTNTIRANPNDAFALTMRGLIWIDVKKDLDVALGDFSEAIRVAPAFVAAYLRRGDALLQIRDFDKAIGDFNDANRLDPTSSLPYYGRAFVWLNKKDYDKAIADYSEAIRLDPQNSQAHNWRGILWDRKEDRDKAIADYSQAIADLTRALILGYDPVQGYLARSVAWFLKGRNDEAIADCRECLSRGNWKYYNAAFALALGHIAARRAGRNEEARKFLDDIKTKGDATAWPFAIIRFLRGEIDDAGLLDTTSNDDTVSDARCFIALDLAFKGKREAPLAHYRWVEEHGTPNRFYFCIATGELGRLEAKQKATAKD